MMQIGIEGLGKYETHAVINDIYYGKSGALFLVPY
jgi:hypothetical protein